MTRFDRRALFASGAAAALLAATGVSLATPRRGGRLRVAVPRVAEGLHPVARGAVFDTLTGLSAEGLLQGRLATSWQSGREARVWRFTLRSDTRFHDGTRVSAADVADDLGGRINGTVSAEGESVRIVLNAADPQLPIRLASLEMGIARADGLGTGLYALDRELPGGGMIARRAHTADAETAGWVDSLEIAAFSDPAVRAEALNEGLVDIALSPDPVALDSRAGLRLLPTPEAPVIALGAHVGVPAWQNHPDLRLAERVWLT